MSQASKVPEVTGKPEITEEEKLRRRKDWEENNVLIRESYVKRITDKNGTGRPPKIDELVADTGLSEKTIRNHFKALSFAELRDHEKKKAAPLLGDMISAVFVAGRGGNAKSQELFLSMMGEVTKKALEHSGPGGTNLFEGVTVNQLNAFIVRKGDNEYVDRALAGGSRGSEEASDRDNR